MKKNTLISFGIVLVLLAITIIGCGQPSGPPGTPSTVKVKMWATLSSDPNATPVTSLTSAQTVQASFWARGVTEESVRFKVNVNSSDGKFFTMAQDLLTEGSTKAIGIGALATPLKPDTYTFTAHSGAFGAVVGSMQIEVTP